MKNIIVEIVHSYRSSSIYTMKFQFIYKKVTIQYKVIANISSDSLVSFMVSNSHVCYQLKGAG